MLPSHAVCYNFSHNSFKYLRCNLFFYFLFSFYFPMSSQYDTGSNESARSSSNPPGTILGMPLDSIHRYSRQAVVHNFGVGAQLKLASAKVAVVGLGGIGSPVLHYLAMSGVGLLGIFDFDSVELHNLHRQSLYNESDIGKSKSSTAHSFVSSINSSINIVEYDIKLSQYNINLLYDYDLILDCTDNLSLRYVINDYCKTNNKLLICSAVLGWNGQICILPPTGRCYRCIFNGMKDTANGCDRLGVINTTCGIIGTMHANEAIKMIINDRTDSQLITYNGYNNEYRCINITGRCECKGYGRLPNIKVNNEESKGIEWKEIIKDKERYKIVDIRSKEHYKMIHVEGAINVESEKIEEIIEGEKEVVVVCYKGKSADEVVRNLENRGVRAYKAIGGMEEYMKYINS